jgi:hypothetical protein
MNVKKEEATLIVVGFRLEISGLEISSCSLACSVLLLLIATFLSISLDL